MFLFANMHASNYDWRARAGLKGSCRTLELYMFHFEVYYDSSVLSYNEVNFDDSPFQPMASALHYEGLGTVDMLGKLRNDNYSNPNTRGMFYIMAIDFTVKESVGAGVKRDVLKTRIKAAHTNITLMHDMELEEFSYENCVSDTSDPDTRMADTFMRALDFRDNTAKRTVFGWLKVEE